LKRKPVQSLVILLPPFLFHKEKAEGERPRTFEKGEVNSFSPQLKTSKVCKKVEITSDTMFYDGTWHCNQFFSRPPLALLGGIFVETTLTAATFPSGPLTGLKVRKKY
jgi:hypothetical protein